MANALQLSIAQLSDKGPKEINQDAHGACIPEAPLLETKGIAVALADGIGSSKVSHIASEAAIKGFLQDYYCTSDAWSVKTSAQRVLYAINSWLYAQTRYSQYCYDQDRGYVCTFSAMIVKSTTAHIFHVGDARVYRVHPTTLEQLTEDHRLRASPQVTYLNRALGVRPQLEIDYRSVEVEAGDVFLLATDGVYEHVSPQFMASSVAQNRDDLDKATRQIVAQALENGGSDNLSLQIVRIDAVPRQEADAAVRQLTEKPFPPSLQARMVFEGYEILRELHVSSRSHVYLVRDVENGKQLVIKVPASDVRADPAALERFLMEEWIARRLDNPHVLKAWTQPRSRNYLYTVTEYVEGQTLAQWMIDNPKPDVETVRAIIEQIGRGLQAMHRLEILHQDLRPHNIMIDRTGTVKLIDFGSARVAGLLEIAAPVAQQDILGTAQYSAPEYFLGEAGTTRSDIFSLGVIAYQMLGGRLPYGTQVAKCRSRAAQRKLQYRSVLDENRVIPAWLDDTLRKAVHPNPYKRYGELSEFMYDLRHPNQAFLSRTRPPLIESNPLLFWKSVALMLAITVVALIANYPATG